MKPFDFLQIFVSRDAKTLNHAEQSGNGWSTSFTIFVSPSFFLLITAVENDITRIASIVVARSVSNRPAFPQLG